MNTIIMLICDIIYILYYNAKNGRVPAFRGVAIVALQMLIAKNAIEQTISMRNCLN